MLRRIVEGIREEHPGVDVRLDAAPAVAAVHRTLSGAITELLELAVGDDPTATDLAISVGADDDRVVVEIVDHGGGIPSADLEAVLEERETPLVHSSGLELWLVRWAVLYSEGTLSVAQDDPTRVVLQLSRATDDAADA